MLCEYESSASDFAETTHLLTVENEYQMNSEGEEEIILLGLNAVLRKQSENCAFLLGFKRKR